METKPPVSQPAARSWDVAPLILLGLTLGLLGSRWETVVGALLALLGLAILVAGLTRWSRRSLRREVTGTPRRHSLSTSA